MVLWVKTPSGKLSYPLAGILLDLHQENFRIWTSLNKICEITLASPLLSDQDLLKESCLIGPWWKRIWWWLGVFGERGLLNKGWVKKQGLALTLNYVNPDEFCDFNNHIVRYSPVFEVFKMGCNIFVGQGTEFIRPDIIESQSLPLPLNLKVFFVNLKKFFT